MKTRVHFNRPAMQQGKLEVWTAHTSRACTSARRIVLKHRGTVVGVFEFRPDRPQPRAFLTCQATQRWSRRTLILDLEAI